MTTALHEEFSRGHEKVERASNRKFGLLVGGIILAIGLVRAYFVGGIDGWSGGLGGVGLALMAAGAFAPQTLDPLHSAWGMLGLLLHKVTNPLMLGLMFGLAIIPTGLIMKALGKDPMARRFNRDASYWIKRTGAGSTADSLKNPF